MASVLQLCRRLTQRPDVPHCAEIAVRHFAGPEDVTAWLELRHRSFARERLGVRRWTADDFAAELTGRWWWQAQRMWLAEASPQTPLPSRGEAGRGVIGGPVNPSSQLVGSVTLAMRGEPESARPVVHWLMVGPAWRRRGIARLLMAHIEAAAWDAGHRQIWLETHAAWEPATRFYQALGFRPM